MTNLTPEMMLRLGMDRRYGVDWTVLQEELCLRAEDDIGREKLRENEILIST